jgi:hypothetical protein
LTIRLLLQVVKQQGNIPHLSPIPHSHNKNKNLLSVPDVLRGQEKVFI